MAMTEETANIPRHLSSSSLAAVGSKGIRYWISIAREKFDLDKFRLALGPKAKD
jgi:hypothetical protein